MVNSANGRVWSHDGPVSDVILDYVFQYTIFPFHSSLIEGDRHNAVLSQ